MIYHYKQIEIWLFFMEFFAVLRIRDHRSGACFTHGSGTQDPGWVKSQDPDEQPESDFRELNLFFLVKILKYFDAIRYPG